MSEAADAEREVEDFFNEEIFGARPPVENEPPFPTSVPEAKPLEEVVLETPEGEAPEGEPEPDTEPDIPDPDSEEVPAEGEVPEAPEVDTEEAHLAWAKKKYGDSFDAENESSKMMAKAAYEQEKLIGKQAQERRELQAQADARELQEQIDALNTPGILTPDEDNWVNEAIVAPDPAEWAYNALQAERPDLYAAVMDRWSSLGELEARTARAFHSRVLQAVTAPKPDEQETYTMALGQTFVSLGLSIDQHGPLILQKAEELGPDHPSVQGMMSTDEDIRRIATRSIFDLVSQGNTTVQKARADDIVAQRVQEEQLRQQTQGIQQGGPRVEQPKKSEFWEQFDKEIEEKGWDGNRPSYGRDE